MRARRILLAAVAAGALSVSGAALAAGDGSSAMGQNNLMTTGVSPDTALSEIEVRDIQNALNNAGHEVTVDGRWGDETEAALAAFQRSEGLTVSGLPDKETKDALASVGSFSSNAYGTGGSAGPSVGTGTSGLTGMSGKAMAPSLPGREGEAVSGNSSGAVHPSTPDAQ